MMFEEREVVEEAAERWWLFLLTGIAWLVFALIVFQWNYTTVYAVSFLFGFVALFAGLNEFFQITVSTSGWKIVHAGSWASSSSSPPSGRSCTRTTRSRRSPP